MVLPSYEDLTKACSDTFNRGFPAGLFKLDAKMKSLSGLENKAGIEHSFTAPEGGAEGGEGGAESKSKSASQSASQSGSNVGSSAALGGEGGEESKETKKQTTGYIGSEVHLHHFGLSVEGKWKTDNELSLEVASSDYVSPGLRLALEALLNAESGKLGGSFGLQFKHPMTTVDVKLEGFTNGETSIEAGLVVGFMGFIGGYKNHFIINEGKLAKNDLSVGYCAGDSMIMGNMDNFGEEFGLSIYHRISGRTEAAAEITYSPEGSEDGKTKAGTVVGVAGRYFLDPATAIRAKVNTDLVVGLGYEQRLRDGVTLSLGAEIEASNFSGGAHKVGLGLEFEG